MPTLRTPLDLAGRVRQEVERNALRARNGIKLAAGLDRPPVGLTPKDVVWQRDRAQLWHYRSDPQGSGGVTQGPPLLIVFSLVTRSYILDLSPGNSFVEHLLSAGFDVYLLDWGVADERDAGNTLEDYCDGYLPAGIERVLVDSGADEVNLIGYCFGGVLSLLSVAHNRLPVRSLTTIATPVDFTGMGLFSDMFTDGRLDVDQVLDETGNVPPNVMRQSFRILKPTAEAAQYATMLENLWNDEYMLAYQTMTHWTSDHIPFAGAAARQSVAMLIRDNGFVTDHVRLAGDAVTLKDVTCPLLNVVAARDHIVPEPACRPVLDLVGSDDAHELVLDAGHIGLAVGRTAAKVTIPQIIEFLLKRSDPLLPAADSQEAS